MKGLTFFLLQCLLFVSIASAVPSNVAAFHRSGQTFITWTEDGGSYDVYRYTAAITTAIIASATKVADNLPTGSGDCSRCDVFGISRVVTADVSGDGLGTQLAAGKGFFVYTAHDTGTFYYAVVSNGTTTVGPTGATGAITEAEAPTKHIIAKSSGSGTFLGMIQYMDYAEYKNCQDGYIFIYSIQRPVAVHPDSMPIAIYLHGYGAFDINGTGVPAADTANRHYEITIDDRSNSWYYGYKDAQGDTTVNYTEARVIDAIDYTLRGFKTDPNKVFAYGHSMGGSGCISMGLRYPNVFAAVFASKGMTNFANEHTGWSADAQSKWGTIAQDLPIKNIGRLASHLKKYDGTPTFNWMNHEQMMASMIRDETPFITSAHGSMDESVIYPDQGQMFYKALNDAKRGFVGRIVPVTHSGSEYGNSPVCGHYDYQVNTPGQNGGVDWRFRRDYSFPALTNSHIIGDYSGPAYGGTKYYNLHLMWGCPWVNMWKLSNQNVVPDTCVNITDTDNEYKVWIQVFQETGTGYLPAPIPADTVDVTPRRCQHFKLIPGAQYLATNTLKTGLVRQTKTLTIGADGLLTFPAFWVLPVGSWLDIKNTTVGTEMRRLEKKVADSYFLPANAPNPFNPSTLITYRVADIGNSGSAKQVIVRIFDSAGKCVRTLVSGKKSLGEYSAEWNGRDNTGSPCASGVYAVVLNCGNESFQRNIVLSK